MATNDVIGVLNDLIETSRDGEEGFRASAEAARSPELKSFFTEGAQRCARAVADLQQMVQRFGGQAAESGTVAGALHRGWTQLKAAVSANDDKAILNEVERGEDHAVSVYRDALAKNLPPDVQAVVQKMYDGARQNHDRVKIMRDRFTAT